MALSVHKFGGAALKDATAIKHVAAIIKNHVTPPAIIVVSALGKTTKNLEYLAQCAAKKKETALWDTFDTIQRFYFNIVKQLFPEQNPIQTSLSKQFEVLKEVLKGVLLLKDLPPSVLDRIVAFGEQWASAIVFHYLKSLGYNAGYVDSTQCIKTDNRYGAAQVLWQATEKSLQKWLIPQLQQHDYLVAAGYIASTLDGHITTLGKEGSDYSAAIYACLLQAKEVIVWKAVEGIYNQDPEEHPEAQVYPSLTYDEAALLSFYGAKVIHPKTLAPLQQKKIPLWVRSFKTPQKQGTCISEKRTQERSPAYTQLKKLYCYQLSTLHYWQSSNLEKLFHTLEQWALPLIAALVQGTTLYLIIKPYHQNHLLWERHLQQQSIPYQRLEGTLHAFLFHPTPPKTPSFFLTWHSKEGYFGFSCDNTSP